MKVLNERWDCKRAAKIVNHYPYIQHKNYGKHIKHGLITIKNGKKCLKRHKFDQILKTYLMTQITLLLFQDNRRFWYLPL